MSEMVYAPVVLFTYNRPIHTKRTVEALKQNVGADKTILYVYSDAPKKEEARKAVEETRAYLHKVTGFREVIVTTREENFGLAKSIITGTTEVVKKHKRVIILEDDLITGKYFLQYMNEALERYQDDKKVFSITGYSHFPEGNKNLPESYFLKVFSSWSWATWEDRWALFDPDATGWEQVKTDADLAYRFNYEGRQYNTNMLLDQMESHTIDSWAIRAYWTQFRHDMVTLFPNKRLVDNEGFDGSGVHCNTKGDYLAGTLLEEPITVFPSAGVETTEAREEMLAQLDAKKAAYKRFLIRHYLTHPAEGAKKVMEKLRGKKN